MLANTVDSPSCATVTFVGHSFLNSTHFLDIYNVTLLVDSHVCGQRSNSMFSKRPREHVARAPPLSLCVGHFGELLEDGGSGRKASGCFFMFLFSWLWVTWDLSPLTRDQTHTPYFGRQSLNHQISREVPRVVKMLKLEDGSNECSYSDTAPGSLSLQLSITHTHQAQFQQNLFIRGGELNEAHKAR